MQMCSADRLETETGLPKVIEKIEQASLFEYIIIQFVCINKCKIMTWPTEYCSFYAVMIWFSLPVSYGHKRAMELGMAAFKQMNKTHHAALIGNF